MNDHSDAEKRNGHPIVTAQQYFLEQQKENFPDASGAFSWLLSGITLATKMIQAKVRRAGLVDILGTEGAVNVQGEEQQKLDVYANRALVHCLGIRDTVGVLASEENDEPIFLRGKSGNAKYAIVFDPLDGSSNIDVNVSVGTIFSILRRKNPGKAAADEHDEVQRDVLQPGTEQVAAGYVVYGSSTILVYTTGQGVHGFTLDPSVGAYVLSHENMRIPERGKYYSVNEAYIDAFPPAYRGYVEGLRKKGYASRYIGSLVADFHRTLLKGGVFMYPPTKSHAEGKLRLLYEANPIAFIAEQAGGRASTGTGRVLEVQPESVHQRTPFVVGGASEMDLFREFMKKTV
jgi:fructose-1,6-bisphosphatase I